MLLKEVISILSVLGVSEDESRLYFNMLNLGPRPVSHIAKHASIRRGKTYNLINGLKKHMLVQELARSDGNHYSAVPIDIVIQKLQEKELDVKDAGKRMKDILTKLKPASIKIKDDAKVEFWRGDAALQVMLDRILEFPNSEIFGFFDYAKRWPAGRKPSLIKWDEQFTKKRVAKNIPITIICNKSPESEKAFKKSNSAMRRIKLVSGISIPVALLLHESTLILTCNSQEVYGVAIRDSTVAQAALELFKSIWETLE